MITVSSLDDMGSIRMAGIYNEFISKVKDYYNQINKSTETCYFYKRTGGWPGKNCFEPSVIKNILISMLNEAGVNIFLKNKVQSVIQSENKVEGIITNKGKFYGQIIIDATEYGDVVMLTSSNYRVGNVTRYNLNKTSCIQDITYPAVIKKYSTVPDSINLRNKPTPPPFYRPQYNSSTNDFDWVPQTYQESKIEFARTVSKDGNNWPGPYPINFITHNAYRAVPDSSNPNNYDSTQPEKITKTFINWANDYSSYYNPGSSEPSYSLPITYITDKNFRQKAICEAKLRTIHFLYYIQDSQGLDQPLWAIANDEGFNTDWNRTENACSNIPESFKAVENNMPPYPYTRESARGVGLDTLTGAEIKNMKNKQDNFSSSVALGIYATDLHGCANNKNLESYLGETTNDKSGHGSVYQIPFNSLIPENLNGFILAGKNISQTRLANAANRVHPTEMLIGQAAGVIAALSLKNNLNARNLSIQVVQWELLKAGSEISLYNFSDVPKTNLFWKDVQFVSTYGLMIGYSDGNFGINDALTRESAAFIFSKLANLIVEPASSVPTFQDVSLTNPFYKYIEAVYKSGIMSGCSLSPMKFCPESAVTRAQFSKIWANALVLMNKLNLNEASNEQIFVDVPSTNLFFPYINLMYQKGITEGCGAGPIFCPSDNTTRGVAAAFLSRTLLNIINSSNVNNIYSMTQKNSFANKFKTSLYSIWKNLLDIFNFK